LQIVVLSGFVFVPVSCLMPLKTDRILLCARSISTSSVMLFRYNSRSAFALALKIPCNRFLLAWLFWRLDSALRSITSKVSADNQGFLMFFLTPTTVSAELHMIEQNESQCASTLSGSVPRPSNLFWTVTTYCCCTAAPWIRRVVSNGAWHTSVFLLAFSNVKRRSDARRSWSVLTGASAPRYALQDLKRPLSRCLVSTWPISFFVTPSCDIQVHR